jgi:hypothetical protein
MYLYLSIYIHIYVYILGLQSKKEEQRVLINDATSLYDGLNLTGISNYSVAVFYYRLALIILNTNDVLQAISILQKCLKIFPSFVPALAGLASVKLSKYKLTYANVYKYMCIHTHVFNINNTFIIETHFHTILLTSQCYHFCLFY